MARISQAKHRAIDVGRVKGETVPAGRELSAGEILALVQVCKADPSPAGVRDAAIIGLLYTGGLRRSELVALDVADFDPETGRLLVRAGKGRKQRTVYIQGGALRALLDAVTVTSRTVYCLLTSTGQSDVDIVPGLIGCIATVYTLMKAQNGL